MTVRSALLAIVWAMAGVCMPLSQSGATVSASTAKHGELCASIQGQTQVSSVRQRNHPVPARHWPKWLYNEWQDEAERQPARYAELVSESPGVAVGRAGVKLVLTLRQSQLGDDVILTLSADKFNCPDRKCHIHASFNGGEPVIYQGRYAQSSLRTVALVGNQDTFIQNIKQTNTLLLRVDLGAAADCEFVFHTAGLRWP